MCALIDARDSYHDRLSSFRELQRAYRACLGATQAELGLLAELRRMHSARQATRQASTELQASQAQQIPYFQIKKKEYEREVQDTEVSSASRQTHTTHTEAGTEAASLLLATRRVLVLSLTCCTWCARLFVRLSLLSSCCSTV